MANGRLHKTDLGPGIKQEDSSRPGDKVKACKTKVKDLKSEANTKDLTSRPKLT